MLSVASLHLYPIKSLGGFPVKEVRITDRGFQHDRRWMLVDAHGRFISQREQATLACLHCTALEDGFRVTDSRNGARIDLPWDLEHGPHVSTMVWDDPVETIGALHEWSTWFSERIGAQVQLVYMPEAIRRPTDPAYAQGITSLSDGFPYLIISQASLDDLNERLAASIPMDRFRPNIVIAGGSAFQEDGWTGITIGGARFTLVKPCARCVITTTDQRTGERGKEPLRTLSTYRRDGEKVLFGMNAMGSMGGMIRVGEEALVIT